MWEGWDRLAETIDLLVQVGTVSFLDCVVTCFSGLTESGSHLEVVNDGLALFVLAGSSRWLGRRRGGG